MMADDDPFADLPTLNGNFPLPPRTTATDASTASTWAEPTSGREGGSSTGRVRAESVEFVDAEEFLAHAPPTADDDADSFLGEASREDWGEMGVDDDDDGGGAVIADGRRPSDIFVERSRNMDQVEFTSPMQTPRGHGLGVEPLEDPPTANATLPSPPSTPITRKPPSKEAAAVTAVNSTASDSRTSLSSDYELHVDGRLVLTPNSFKYLQEREKLKQRSRMVPPTPERASTPRYMLHAQSIVGNGSDRVCLPTPPGTPQPINAEEAMNSGPRVIKRALHEIQSMIRPTDTESVDSDADSVLEGLRARLRDKLLVLDHGVEEGGTDNKVDGTESATTNGIFVTEAKPRVTKTDSTMDEGEDHRVNPRLHDDKRATHSGGSALRSGAVDTTRNRDRNQGTVVLQPKTAGKDAACQTKLLRVKLYPNEVDQERPSCASSSSPLAEDRLDPSTNHSRKKSSDPASVLARKQEIRNGQGGNSTHLRTENSAGVGNTANTAHTANTYLMQRQSRPNDQEAIEKKRVVVSTASTCPSQIARRCRRLLCTVGDSMAEKIIFANGSDGIARVCVSLLPLSTGCQQFSISPAVLEIQPRSSKSFVVSFDARQVGVAAGIFQFRGVGANRLFAPYEVLIEASVRDASSSDSRNALPHRLNSHTNGKSTSSKSNIRVQELPLRTQSTVQITPTFIKFESSEPSENPTASIRIFNDSPTALSFKAKCSHEHIKMVGHRGTVPAAESVTLQVSLVCRPFGYRDEGARWCGSMTVAVGDVLTREISLVVDHDVLETLPSFEDLARQRHSISSQTDSFYYTKKVNRRGLYFHARAVECGSCHVGESHEVPVYICNGSDAPMTVFLQALQEPFSCSYSTTTLHARKYIEVPITFTPKVAGKVATSLVAYSVDGKAAVTLIARGVDPSKEV